MAIEPRRFAGYRAALTLTYEEKISGETFFEALAGFHQGRARNALMFITEMERVTAKILAPPEWRRALPVANKALLRAEGIVDAQPWRGKIWPELATHMRDDCPAYVEEFADLVGSAPDEDKPLVQALVDHEVAIVDFACAELGGVMRTVTRCCTLTLSERPQCSSTHRE